MSGEELSISVKWSGENYSICMQSTDSILLLKKSLQEKTNVPTDRIKILGLKKKKGRAPVEDVDVLSEFDLLKSRIMMVGQPDQIVDQINVELEKPDIIDDFDVTEEHKQFRERPEYVAKVEKRIKSYEIKQLFPSREGKKLLVLDIDYTLFDHRSCSERFSDLTRPHLHDFLAKVHPFYDIAIWSATNMKWIEVKMTEMGCVGKDQWQFVFYLDSRAMISVHSAEKGLIDVKPLQVIWGKFPDVYTPNNTIMFDDISRNFLMNPENGLKIKAFRNALIDGRNDDQLEKLARYLVAIEKEEDLSKLDHYNWSRYLRKAESGEP